MRKRAKVALGLAGTAALAYLGVCVALYTRQRKLLYAPTPVPADGEARTLPLRAHGPQHPPYGQMPRDRP